MLVLEAKEMGLDEDTLDIVADRANRLLFSLDGAIEERELNRVESDLGRLQIVVRQAAKRGRRNQ